MSIELATSSSATIVMRDNSQISITSMGGRASYVVTPTSGAAQSRTFGPGVETAVIGPFDEGATLVITNLSASLAYRYIGGNIPTLSDDGASLVSGAGIIPINGLRVAPVRVATFGDSTANIGNTKNTSAAPYPDTTRLIPSAWNSGTKTYGISLDKFAADLYYPQMYVVGCGGVSGENTTQMIARDTAGAGVTRFAITDIINLNPQAVFLRGGSINDLLTVTSGTLVAVVAATYANHVLIANRLMSAGIMVIDEGIYGFTNGTANTATDQASTRSAILQLNALYKAYAALYPSLMRFVDPTGVVSDATGGYMSGMSTDGTHPNAVGQMAMGVVEAALVAQLFGQSSNIRYPGANLVTNALMANASGGTATGFTVAATVSSVAQQKIESINGKIFQTAEWTLASGTNVATINIPYDPTAMSILSGDVYGFEYDLYFIGLEGYVPVAANLTISGQVRTDNTVGSGQIYVNRMAASNGYGSLVSGIIGHVTFPPIQYGDVSANFTTASRFQVVVTTTDASGKFKLGVGNPRIVKLDQAVKTI